MDYDWGKFLTAHASAIFALAGALGGGILSFIGALLLKRREFSLSVSGRLLDRRIAAHEKVIALAIEMRVMVALEKLSDSGEVRRAPQVMISRDTFEDWFARFTNLSLEGTSWLSTMTKREVNYAQDYLVTLHVYLERVPSDQFLGFGEIIRQDFVDLSASLEKTAFTFFQSGVRKLQPDSLDNWHKYERAETERRLASTLLVIQRGAFVRAQNNGQAR